MHTNVLSSAVAVVQPQLCARCGYGGCDVKSSCGCCLHARCTPVSGGNTLACHQCSRPVIGLFLLPMSFFEIDEARKAAATLSASGKRGKKRKTATIARLNPEVSASTASSVGPGSTVGDVENGGGSNESSDLRTGRWTSEETSYCDKLIAKFQSGELPLVDGTKLNDFLANMLKSKQSRLTKKMKNAKLSSKTFTRKSGFIVNVNEAREFSEFEDSFYRSVQCSMERSEIRFHMQKEWRELFSSFCVASGQSLDADAWLSSVEEMERRMSQAKDKARMARRKLMMGYALSRDAQNPDQGVIIDGTSDVGANHHGQTGATDGGGVETDDLLNLLLSKSPGGPRGVANGGASLKARVPMSPFLARVVAYIQRNRIPFEHVDSWVPSFVPSNKDGDGGASPADPKCRLCFAGSASTDVQVSSDSQTTTALTDEDHFDLIAFGEYSQKFSFEVGCGLPGRVYQSGISSWEQNVQNAPGNHFERCGGAVQWGIKTVLGLPIPSPNVGRVVVVFYSRYDRQKNQEMVGRMCEELGKMLPSPKWKLVVDIGSTVNGGQQLQESTQASVDCRVSEIVKLMEDHMPANSKSPSAPYLPGFTSLKLSLLKTTKTQRENEMLRSLIDSYSSYVSTGRSNDDIAMMLARDYMFLSHQPLYQQLRQQQPIQVLPATTAVGGVINVPNTFGTVPAPGLQQSVQQIIPTQQLPNLSSFQVVTSVPQANASTKTQVTNYPPHGAAGGRLSA